MRAAIVLSTTLWGLAQGLLLALVGIEILVPQTWHVGTLAAAAWTVLGLLAAGLVGWVAPARSSGLEAPGEVAEATRWRARERIVAPLLIVAVGAHALALAQLARGGLTPAVALAMQVSTPLAVILAVALAWCVGRARGAPLALAAIGVANGLALATAGFACALPRIDADTAPGALPPFDLAPDLTVFDNAHACIVALAVATVVATLLAVGAEGVGWWGRRARPLRAMAPPPAGVSGHLRPPPGTPGVGGLGESFGDAGARGGSSSSNAATATPASAGSTVAAMAPMATAAPATNATNATPAAPATTAATATPATPAATAATAATAAAVVAIVLGAVLPLVTFAASAATPAYPTRAAVAGLCIAAALQTVGVLVERWLFLARATARA